MTIGTDDRADPRPFMIADRGRTGPYMGFSAPNWRSWFPIPYLAHEFQARHTSLCCLARAGPPVAFGEAWGCFGGVVGGLVWVVGLCGWCGDDAGGQGSFLTLPLAPCGGRPRQGFATPAQFRTPGSTCPKGRASGRNGWAPCRLSDPDA